MAEEFTTTRVAAGVWHAEKGIRHHYWTLPGAAHTWVVWRTALSVFLPLLWRNEC